MRWLADNTNAGGFSGDATRGATPVRTSSSGCRAPNILNGDDIADDGDEAIVFALANPDPEVDPYAAAEHAAVVATGRSD